MTSPHKTLTSRFALLPWIAGVLSLCFLPIAAAQVFAELPEPESVPGGIAIVAVGSAAEAAPRVEFQGNRVLVARQFDTWHAIVGLPLSLSPGRHTLTVTTMDGTESSPTFEVDDKTYAEQR
ncbi:MAG: hypothetical protein ACKVP2_01365, partial [Burkholderiales bacterium]